MANPTIKPRQIAPGITNSLLASDVGRLNQLVNGGFEIWQRWAGTPVTVSGAYTADRWPISLNGTDTMSVSKDTTNFDSASSVCAACTFTLGTGAGQTQLYQGLKWSEYTQLVGRILTCSVRVKTTTANAIRVGLYNGAVWTYGNYHSGSGNYETLTVTAPLSVVANGVGQVSLYFAATCVAYIDNAMLVIGSVAADYAPLPPADDLARCLRYYEIIGSPGLGDLLVGGFAAGGAGIQMRTNYIFKAVKAIVPTVTKVGTWGVANASQPSAGTASTLGFWATMTATADATDSYAINSVAGNCFTAEANP